MTYATLSSLGVERDADWKIKLDSFGSLKKQDRIDVQHRYVLPRKPQNRRFASTKLSKLPMLLSDALITSQLKGANLSPNQCVQDPD